MKYPFLLLFLFLALFSSSQTTNWAINAGGTAFDKAQTVKVAPNGNICIAGKFMGTMDLDPSAAVFNVTSAGLDDIFVACYDSAHNFQWGFRVGGPLYDAAWYMNIDAASNVIICGYFQSGGIDFDPGAGVTTLPFAGGTTLTFYGDGFVAKYSATGAFQWAKGLGGPLVFDVTVSVATDATGNVYVGGVFNTSMVVSPTITLLSAVAGSGYLIKYDPAGNVIWAHNYGMPAVGGADCFPRSIQVSGTHLYVGGFFTGTANFFPWGTGAFLTAVGTYDPYVAKYDLSGNFVFVKQVQAFGGTDDEFGSLSLDASENIYLSGWSNSSSITFDPSSPATTTVTAPGGGGNLDVIFAKYNSSGVFQWGKVVGAAGDDIGYCIDNDGSHMFLTGQFKNTTDFDPSTSVANLTSAGGADMFIGKYDLNGNYVCAFNVGSAGTDDAGLNVTHDPWGHLYSVGQFGGASVDFDPSSLTYNLTSVGSLDAYLAKYSYVGPVYTGVLLKDTTICAGDSAYLTIHITSGPTGPYTVTIAGGTGTVTVTGATSDVPFSIGVLPPGTTSYYVTSATYAGPGGLCQTPTATIDDTVTINVLYSTAIISTPSVFCDSVIFTAAPGGGSYTWNFGDGTTATGTPVTHTYSAAGTFTVTLTTNNGSCTATATRTIVVNASAPIVGELQLCAGETALFTNALAGGTWTCTPSSVATISSFGVMTAIANGVATITYTTTCGQVTKSVTINSITTLINDIPPICAGKTAMLSAAPTGGIWKSSATAIATVSGSGMVTGVSQGTAIISYLIGACTDTTTVEIYPGANIVKVTFTNPTCNEQNGSITLEGLQTGESYVMRWQDPNADSTVITADGSGNVVLTPLAPGIYQAISVKNSYGCSSAGAGPVQLVNIAPPPPVIKHNDPCEGQTLFLEGNATPSGGVYQWAFPDGSTNTLQNITRRSAKAIMSGVYALSYTVNSCTVTTTANVTIYTPPSLINMTPDKTIKWGESVQLFVEGAFVYRWAPNDGSIDNPNINNPVVSPEATTRYYVYGANEVGCVDTATVEITVNDAADEFIPTAFTPNGDGLNDIFRIRRLQRSQKLIEFSIYNRFGERVYHNEYSPDAGWDGTFNGQPCDIGTYYYQVILGLRDGTKRVHKGDVTLIR